jgi:hypothetical protein
MASAAVYQPESPAEGPLHDLGAAAMATTPAPSPSPPPLLKAVFGAAAERQALLVCALAWACVQRDR